MEARHLYLDPGPAGTGWAIRLGDGRFSSGTQRFKRSNALDWEVLAADRYVPWLVDALSRLEPDTCYCEATFAGRNTGRWLMWASLQTELICHRRGIAFRPINAASLKKWATGNGRAKDREMVAAARARGYDPRTPHEADAILMHEMVAAQR